MNFTTPFSPLSRRKSFYGVVENGYTNPLRININSSITRQEYNDAYSLLMETLLSTSEEHLLQLDIQKSGNIILDMDGTLGDNIPSTFQENPERFCKAIPIPRPGLKSFFAFVFAHYERVSIWTAASPDWYALFKERVLRPNMPPGAEFHFEQTRNLDIPYVPLKPLSEIYAKYPEEYNESNTTIVDDNVETFRENRANAVHIPPFFYDDLGGSPETRRKNAAKDRGLYTVMEVLAARQNKTYQIADEENKPPTPTPLPTHVFL
jgi:hypothetical protein